jgi:hypothetical protein
MSDHHRLNVVVGYPVASSNDVEPDTAKLFYGLNMDIGPYLDGWNFNLYAINQDFDGFIDRQAVGMEARYFKDGKSLFTTFDYDAHFSVLNSIFILGSLDLTEDTSLSGTIDIRKSPILTQANALQGQQLSSLEELETAFPDEDLEDIARDRTPESRLYSLNLRHELNDKFSVYGGVSMTEMTGTPASAGVDALAGTDSEYSYDLQLVGNSILADRDVHIVSWRLFDGSASQRTSLRLDSRFNLPNRVRINPRLRYDSRENTVDSKMQRTLRPSLRVDFRWKTHMYFEAELGYEWSERELTETANETADQAFGSLGYRYEF